MRIDEKKIDLIHQSGSFIEEVEQIRKITNLRDDS